MNYKKMGLKLLFDRVDDASIQTDFKMVAAYKAQLSKLKRDSLEHKVLREQLHLLRQAMKTKAHGYYRIRIEKGGYFNEHFYDKIPDVLGFKEVADDFANDIRSLRAGYKNVNVERKNTFGFRYQTTGGVFDAKEKNSILTIGQSTDPMRRLGQAKVPHEKIKANFVGIELELMSTANADILSRAFIKESLAGYVHIKTDSSIQIELGGEQGHEITMLCRQENAESIINKICKVLNSKDINSKVNNSCGFHLHIDMRHRDPYVAYNNLVRALPLLNKMVPTVRLKGENIARYCRQNTTNNLKDYFPDPKNIHGTRLNRDNRYQAINPYSLVSLSTLEVRLHSGTTNAKKISMWTKICLAIADAPELKETVSNVMQFEDLVLRDQKISEYMNKRIALFEDKKDQLDTRADHMLDTYEKEVG